MLDLSHIPNSQQDIKIFYKNRGATVYQTWQKPRKCSFIYIISIDAGGGGSSGYSMPLNGNQSTPGGGGSGAVTRALINSNLVPDILYIAVGKGGAGGASTSGADGAYNAGVGGGISGVFISSQLNSPDNLAQTVSFIGGAASANAGNGGIAVSGTPASTLSNNYLIGLTNFISLVGVGNGATAGQFMAFSIAPLVSQIVTTGAPGAPCFGTSIYDGGSIIATSISPLIAGGIGGSTLGGNGADGYTSWKPFFSTGGAGGGNSVTAGGVAGSGGNGGIGSGGGAGGNAGGGTSGKGGDGGDGIVIIVAF